MYSESEQQDLKQFGNNIRNLRKARGFSQESFADAVGLHRTYMGGVERGERNVSLLNLLKIMRKLEVSSGDILENIH